MLQNVYENCVRILDQGKHRPYFYIFIILWKRWRKLTSSSINQNLKSQKQCVHPRTLLLWQRECVKCHQHQFTVALNNWTFRRQHWDEFCIKALVWCRTKFNWFRSWSQLTIQCVFAALSESVIDLKKMPILAKKKKYFQMKLWSCNKQNCCIGSTENPRAYIEKPTHPKRVFCTDFGTEE